MTAALPLDPSLVPLAALFGMVVVALLLRRVPVVGPVLGLLSWLGLIFALYVAFEARGRFDPQFARLSDMFADGRQSVTGGGEVRIAMAPDGHFWARAEIGGVEQRMLVDSGATITALSVDTAAAAGLEPRDGPFPVVLRTANGEVRAQTAEVPELRLGSIVARDLPVVVSPAFGAASVLGMNFLSRLRSWRVEGRTLILVPHHPQAAD